MMILLGVIAVLVAPTPMSRIASAAAAQPALSFGAGLLTFIVGILAGTLLLIACCLGLFVWLALADRHHCGLDRRRPVGRPALFAALKVHNVSPLVEVSLGVFLITVIGRLPWCVGALFSVVVGSIGLGAVVLTRFGRQPIVSKAGERQCDRRNRSKTSTPKCWRRWRCRREGQSPARRNRRRPLRRSSLRPRKRGRHWSRNLGQRPNR